MTGKGQRRASEHLVCDQGKALGERPGGEKRMRGRRSGRLAKTPLITTTLRAGFEDTIVYDGATASMSRKTLLQLVQSQWVLYLPPVHFVRRIQPVANPLSGPSKPILPIITCLTR